ncbi:unnamed protein product [Acanthoscelides obtectus]|uniref:Uncharacterized protein n=1 Tax=Acanthoscelides obtectus TaxID=200917 RepID=A0A9P0LVH3_ACAOB|nr:unnamed protein product [Acanthoscelides obtectus]CAK1660476.1 hypothetical protein AOBTE_LOCUS22096 [Acanthoscelides obtectus]
MSVTRKNLLVPGLKISKELADDCLPGEFLFGSNLTQKLDTAKSLLNVSKDLKLPTYQNKVGASKPALAPRRAQKGGGGQTRAVYTETSRSSGGAPHPDFTKTPIGINHKRRGDDIRIGTYPLLNTTYPISFHSYSRL